MKLILLLFSLFCMNVAFSQGSDFKNQKSKVRAYTYPMGSMKLISDKCREYKIKLPASEIETKIVVFLNTYDPQSDKYMTQRVQDIFYTKGNARSFSILVDTVNNNLQVMLSAFTAMGKFKIESNENLKFIFIDSEKRSSDLVETIALLYLDKQNDEIEKKMKNKGIIDEQSKSQTPKIICKDLKPCYTITYKEEKL